LFKIIIFAFIFVLILCFVLFAQDEAIKFFSSVDKTQVDANELLNFKINLEGDFKQEPGIELPKLEEDFDVLSSANSENVSWQQGKVKKSSVLEFVLSPKKIGVITIGPARLKIGTKTYTTNPIQITVTGKINRGNVQPGPDEKNPLEEGNQEEGDKITL
jgi:hypothetical protein